MMYQAVLITNQYNALDRLTNRLDGLGQTRYFYTVPGHGYRIVTEDQSAMVTEALCAAGHK